MHDPISDWEKNIADKALVWAKVRRTIFAKEKTDISDWELLGKAEHDLMEATKIQ